MKKVMLLVIVAVIGVLLYQSFYTKEEIIPEIIQTTSEIKLNDTLNLGILKFDTTNPIKSKNEQIHQINRLIYEPLFDITNEFKAEPCLVKEYSKIEKSSYLIKIRENIVCHDNTILTALDVQDAINRIREEEEAIYYNNVKNIKSIAVIDETTLRLNLYEPEAFFEYNLIFPIVKNENIGTGKYMISGDTLVYNSQYWKDIEPSITTIKIKQYQEIGQMYQAFKNGEIDVINTSGNEYKNILGDIGFNIKEYTGREHTYLVLNGIQETVRQAIYYALNKKEFVSKVYNNNYYDKEYPLDISNWLYKDIISYKYDIEKAIDLLENDGWEFKNNNWYKDKEKIELSILLESTDEAKNEIAYILKNQLQKIGIQVELEKVSKKLYNDYLQKGNYDIIIKSKYIGVSPNLAGYFAEEPLIEKISNSNNEREIIELYNQLEEKYTNELPFISLCGDKKILIYSEKIYGNIRPNWYNIFYEIENWKKINKNS